MTYTKPFLVGCVLTTLFLQSNGRAIASYSGSGSDDVSGSGSYEGEAASDEAVVYEINFGRGDEHISISDSSSDSSSGSGNVTGNDDELYNSNISMVAILIPLSPLICGVAMCVLTIIYFYILDNCVPYCKKIRCKISNKLEERNLPIKNSKLNSRFIKKLNKENLEQVTKKAENTTLECTICIDDINLKKYKNKITQLVIPNCGHIYHTNCLNTWVRSQILNGQQPTCPTCRTVICDSLVTKSYTVYNIAYDSDSDSLGGYLDNV